MVTSICEVVGQVRNAGGTVQGLCLSTIVLPSWRLADLVELAGFAALGGFLFGGLAYVAVGWATKRWCPRRRTRMQLEGVEMGDLAGRGIINSTPAEASLAPGCISGDPEISGCSGACLRAGVRCPAADASLAQFMQGPGTSGTSRVHYNAADDTAEISD